MSLNIILFIILLLLPWNVCARSLFLGSISTSGCAGWNCGFATDPDLVGLYRFENVSSFGDDTKSTNDLTKHYDSVDMTLNSTYKTEGSYSLDVIAGYKHGLYRIDADLTSDFPGKYGTENKTFTACSWVRYDAGTFPSVSDVDYWVGKYETTTGDRSWRTGVYNSAGNPKADVWVGYNSGNSGSPLRHDYTLSAETWYFICGSYDNSDKSAAVRIRTATGAVFGADKTGTLGLDANKMYASDTPFYINRSDSDSGNFRMTGNYDEVTVWKRVLTADEVTSISKGLYGNGLYCAACPSASQTANIMCEVPDGTADGMCGLGIQTTGSGIVTATYACDDTEALGCSDILTPYCIRMAQTDCGSTDDLYAWHTTPLHATDYVGDIYIQAYVKILSAPTESDCVTPMDPTHDIEIIGFTPSSLPSDYAGNVYLALDGGPRIGLHYHDAIPPYWHQVTGSSTITSNGTDWIGIRMHVHNDATAGQDYAEWWIDYTNSGTWVEQTAVTGKTFDRAFKYVIMGQNLLQRKFDVQMTGIKVSTTAMPPACVR